MHPSSVWCPDVMVSSSDTRRDDLVLVMGDSQETKTTRFDTVRLIDSNRFFHHYLAHLLDEGRTIAVKGVKTCKWATLNAS